MGIFFTSSFERAESQENWQAPLASFPINVTQEHRSRIRLQNQVTLVYANTPALF